MLKTPRQKATDRGGSGQALVEFALVIPILMLLVMGIIEVGLMFNGFVGVNRASQHAAHVAATVGDMADADCIILAGIESDVTVPNDRGSIQWVSIQLTSMAGNQKYAEQLWTRTGATSCPLPEDPTATVPYTLSTATYPDTQRCPVLDGCPGMVIPRSTVDSIGVAIRYRHQWVTPLNAVHDFFGGGSFGWEFTQRNIFRMEPTT